MAQRAALETFFLVDLKGGALAFDWVHPAARTPCVMVMAAPPRIAAETGSHFIASLDLRVQP